MSQIKNSERSKGKERSEKRRGENRDRNNWREKKKPNTVPTIQQQLENNLLTL